VRGGRNRRTRRSRYLLGEPLGDVLDVLDVFVAHDDQRRYSYVCKALGGGRVETIRAEIVVALLQPEGLTLHLRDVLSEARIDLLQAAVRPGEPGAQVRLDRGIEITALERLLLKKDVTVSDQSWSGSPAPTSTSAETRSGDSSASSSAVLPPSETPTTAARSMPATSSASRTAPR